MANYTASALLAAQTRYTAKMNEPELRRKQNPALMLAIGNQTGLITDDIQALKKKDTRPVKVYIKTPRAAAATTVKSHNHQGGKADSKEYTLAFIQIVEPFSILRKQGQSNIIPYSEQLEHEIRESAKNIHDRAGTLAQTFLQANRTQVNIGAATGGAGTWENVNKVLEVAAGDKDRFFQMAGSFMRKRNYRGALDMLADQPAFRSAEYLRNQGNANATNLSWQLGQNTIVETTEDIDANYTKGAILAMPKGAFGAFTWNDPENLKGSGDYDEYNGGYGVLDDPLGSGLKFDFHAYSERVNGSANGGGVQDVILEAELTLTISWILAPLSTANDSVVHEIVQM